MKLINNLGIPKLSDVTTVGVVLLEIVNVRVSRDNKFLRVEALASTLTESNKKITINLFENSYKITAKELINKAMVNSLEDLKGTLWYARLSVNSKGFQEIDELYFKVKEDKLIFDSRTNQNYNYNALDDLF